jgi:hypothetical protein
MLEGVTQLSFVYRCRIMRVEIISQALLINRNVDIYL